MTGFKFFLTTMAFFFLLWGTFAIEREAVLFLKVSPPQRQEFFKGRECDCTELSRQKEKGSSVQEQVSILDDQIRDLEEMKRGFEAKALRHDDQALRLQFNQEWNLEVRRHLELAEENRQKAALVQQEIDRLQAIRKRLIGEYGGQDGFEDL